MSVCCRPTPPPVGAQVVFTLGVVARIAVLVRYLSQPRRGAITETTIGCAFPLLGPVGKSRACLAVVSSQVSAPRVCCQPLSARSTYMTASVGSPCAYGANSSNPGNPCGTSEKRGTYWLYRNAFLKAAVAFWLPSPEVAEGCVRNSQQAFV